MTQDEQNSLDLDRMNEKRQRAFALLDEFTEWQGLDKTKSGTQIILIGLNRDIIRGTEKELDDLIANMEERNHQSLMKKMSEGLDTE